MFRSKFLLLAGVLLATACNVQELPAPSLRDSGASRDATAQAADALADAGVPIDDAGVESDAEVSGDGSVDAGGGADAEVCGLGELGDPDRQRMLLLGHPFGSVAGQNGTEVRSMTLAMSGTPADDGMRLDVGTRVQRIAFTPSGTLALVLGEDGTLVSVNTPSATTLSIADTIALPPSGYEDLVITADGRTAYAIGFDVGTESGISTVNIACDGTLSIDNGAFFNIRLSESLALLPGETRAILLGGQTVFAPIDDNDVRLIERTATGWIEIDAFDIYMDFIDAGRIGVSPDGSLLLIPNGSPASAEGGDVVLASISGDVVTEIDRFMGLDDVREALWAPDGRTALLTQLEPGRVAVITDLGSGLEVATTVTGIGLADQTAMIARGLLSGRVYLPSVDPNGGPNVAMLSIDGPGIVANLGQVELGNGGVNIPEAIAVTP